MAVNEKRQMLIVEEKLLSKHERLKPSNNRMLQ